MEADYYVEHEGDVCEYGPGAHRFGPFDNAEDASACARSKREPDDWTVTSVPRGREMSDTPEPLQGTRPRHWCPSWHFLPGPYQNDPERTECPYRDTHESQRRIWPARPGTEPEVASR